MRMWKKMTVIAASVCAAALMLAGCGNPTAAGGDDVDTSAAGYWPKVDTKLDGVKLNFWTAQSSNKVPVKVVDEFNKLTGAQVTIQTIPDNYEQNFQTKVTTGDVPDLALWQPTKSMLAGFVAQSKLQKLDNGPWNKNYKDGLLDVAGEYNGARYAVLFSMPPVMGVYYNKDVFKAAGITDLPKNWDEFVAAAKKIKEANVPGVDSALFEMAGSQWGTQWAVQTQLADAAKDGLWDRVNKNQEKFTDDTILTAIKNYKSLFDEGLYNKDAGTAKDSDQAAALWNGKTGMIIQVDAMFNSVATLAKNDKTALDKKIGFFPISAKSNTGTTNPEQNNAVVAFKTGDAKKEAAARQFINFWMSDGYADFVKDQQRISVLKTVDTPDTIPQAALDAADAVTNSVGDMQAQAIANPDLYVYLSDMVNGTKTPQQVAEATQSQFAQVAKAQGAQGF